ncbi:PRC-barrel domain-containing protein [Acuticoccus sp. MNP-M23]|uniref:PRC-barrel domain-containing protein n=1 Tax=Acuticoccus sp. MNP-M23 TaxID=3072793 RepID=UPI0028156119|nr:PRC-barrel domain-containing protein [Acuticoccus sp. MNP-M23]WMS41630.1 PRC-barrel domain-containing protein [Acuticoccus sp. MNP-M23]
MRFLTATAAALIFAATPALSQQAAPTSTTAMTEADYAQLIRTRDITGGPIYTTNEAHDEGSWGRDGDTIWGWSEYDGVGADWNKIGEIEDIILDRSGKMVGVVAEVGGFLDIGDKHVMIRVGDLDLVPIDDGTFSLITRYNEEQLEELPSVDEGFWD